MPHTLLLADDSVTIQRVIELTFADEDVRVIAVSDGDQAIASAEAEPPDIVLADVGMPGRNGYEVARHIKETPRLAHIPVVLLTGAFEPIDQAKAAAAGCDGVLAKPFEPQLVIGRVKELLARPKQVAASIDAPLSPPPVPAPPWMAPRIEPPPARATAKPAPGEVDQYFDRLGQAFANLSGAHAEAAKPTAPSQAVADSIDWFASQPPPIAPPAVPDRWDVPPASPPPDLPLSYASPQADFDRTSEALTPTFAPAHLPVPLFDQAQGRPTPMPLPAPPPTLPPLADAFAALLLAEQSAPPPSAAPAWPAPGPAGMAVTDDVIEKVTRRVLDRLTDRVVRETVAEKISAVAERLVREEIERIKASLK